MTTPKEILSYIKAINEKKEHPAELNVMIEKFGQNVEEIVNQLLMEGMIWNPCDDLYKVL